MPGVAGADTATSTPFSASFSGTFSITPETTGAVLRFTGQGTGTNIGSSSITGESLLGPQDSDGCSQLLRDAVTVTAADGSSLFLTNAAVDCVSGNSINGKGSYRILGGTGRLAGASGEGRVSTAALITGGTFDPLTLQGVLTH